MARDELIRRVAARHGLGEGAVAALRDALERGGGRMAQFSHPELGGMGQWAGGMLQIGAMFDHALKARVAGALADLAGAAPAPAPQAAPPPGSAAGMGAGPWPESLGAPSASGAQDGTRYAWFAAARRLVIVRGGRVTVYDTASHRIRGASQGGAGGRLRFASDRGEVDVAALRVVGTETLTKE